MNGQAHLPVAHMPAAHVPAAQPQPYVRPSRFELEPAVFAAAVVAVVMTICGWNPVATGQQHAVPVENTQTVAQAPRS